MGGRFGPLAWILELRQHELNLHRPARRLRLFYLDPTVRLEFAEKPPGTGSRHSRGGCKFLLCDHAEALLI